MICDNPKCQHHLNVPRGMDDRRHVYVLAPSLVIHWRTEKVWLERFLYRKGRAWETTEFYLCESCHNAVEMAKEVRHERAVHREGCAMTPEALQEFAVLAYAAGQEAAREAVRPAWRQSLEYARGDEREECAKVCEGMQYISPQPHHYAAAIRARGRP